MEHYHTHHQNLSFSSIIASFEAHLYATIVQINLVHLF